MQVNQKNNLLRVLAKSGNVSLIAIDSTDIVWEMERIHKPSATASAALGRLLTGAALMGSMLKTDGESISLKVDGGGPIGTVTAICDAHGHVRGSCTQPLADLPLNEKNGKLNVGGIVGHDGTLTVMRDFGFGDPYIGTVPLVSGEIAEDLTNYYATSEQVPAAVALGVLVNPDLTIRAAGGFLLQMLPGAGEEEISRAEHNLAGLEAVTTLLDRGSTAQDIAFRVLDGFETQIIAESRAEYRCNCSRDKMRRVLKSLGEKELRQLADEQEITEIVCSYCDARYEFTSAQLLELVQK